MPTHTTEWVHLALRWFHVFAGILWIGATWFFGWLDRRLEEAAADAEGKPPQVWMVHSGGFYIVEKQKVPALLPGTLHWFKWEAALTWLSGIALLALVYWGGGLMVDPSAPAMSNGAAVALSAGLLVAAWVAYDLVWRSPLGRHEVAGAFVCYALLVAAAWWLTRVFPGRTAYMQIGAMMGTIMTANVWMRILPAQRAMLAAIREGRTADMALGERAKKCSKHNSFMVVPVVFIMISSHFPTLTYGRSLNWLVLAALILAGWGAAAAIRR